MNRKNKNKIAFSWNIIFCNVINVFTVTFGRFNVSLINKKLSFKNWPQTFEQYIYLLLKLLGVENRSMAGVELMVPVGVENGDAAVVEDVEGFLVSFLQTLLLTEESNHVILLITLLIWYDPI